MGTGLGNYGNYGNYGNHGILGTLKRELDTRNPEP
jgi:hypothetical protein